MSFFLCVWWGWGGGAWDVDAVCPHSPTHHHLPPTNHGARLLVLECLAAAPTWPHPSPILRD